MKRHNELLRDILLDLAAYPLNVARREVCIDGFSPGVVKEHLVLLHDHRLIECLVVRGAKGELAEVVVKQITEGGHEFIRGAKEAQVWKETLALAKSFEFGPFIASLKEFTCDLLGEAPVLARPKPYRY